MEGGAGPTEPVQAAYFNVSEELFLDLHGRRIKDSVCSKVLVLGAPLIMQCSCDFLLDISFICHYAAVYVRTYVVLMFGSSFGPNMRNSRFVEPVVFDPREYIIYIRFDTFMPSTK